MIRSVLLVTGLLSALHLSTSLAAQSQNAPEPPTERLPVAPTIVVDPPPPPPPPVDAPNPVREQATDPFAASGRFGSSDYGTGLGGPAVLRTDFRLTWMPSEAVAGP